MSEDRLWIWGRHSVLEALRAGGVRRVLLAAGRKPSPVLDEIRRTAGRAAIPISEVPRAEIDRLAPGQNTQGVAAQIVDRRFRDVADLLAQVPAGAIPFLVALDQIQDPHNMGALLRTADAAGVHGVITPERRSASLTGIVAKTSAGAISRVPLAEITNLSRSLDEAREAGCWTIGLDGEAPQSIFNADMTGPVALVVGSEGSGLRRLTRQHCDLLVHIPMFGSIESLNASVAGSIAMYEIVRQRLRSPS